MLLDSCIRVPKQSGFYTVQKAHLLPSTSTTRQPARCRCLHTCSAFVLLPPAHGDHTVTDPSALDQGCWPS